MASRRCLALLAVLAVPALLQAAAGPGDSNSAPPVRVAEQSAPVTPRVFDGDVRDLPRPRPWRPGDPVRVVPQRFYDPLRPAPAWPAESSVDPLLGAQRDFRGPVTDASRSFIAPSRGFDGYSYTGMTPPDSVGDIGPNHYIQLVNGMGDGIGVVARIFDRTAPVANELASFQLLSLASGNCASGFADPIVLYDREADRWLLSEFSSYIGTFCVYVSQTSDPVTGGWYAYEFVAPVFPDYPKYAVWATDANGGAGSYLMTSNEDPRPGIYALDRAAMLSGSAATYQRFSLPPLTGFQIQSPIPADPDGPNPPPDGTPAIILRHRDTEAHGGPAAPGDLLEMWILDVDWLNPSNTTFTQGPSIDVAEFDSDLCSLTSLSCFVQPDAAPPLMPLHEPTMHRLQYMNHNGFETLVGNFTVDADGMDLGGIRWFELRRGAGEAWSLRQEGTYSADSDNRWLGSLAMDITGNIALGLNVVSATTYPALRYTGREAADPIGVMTQPETTLAPGVDFEASERYGDYSAMSLDPVDDCTFWFTGEYSDAGQWATRIASFKFDSCPCTELPGAPLVQAEVAGENRIDVLWDDSALAGVDEYEVRRSRDSGGPYELIATVQDSSPGIGDGPGYSHADTDVSGGITYYYVVVAGDGGFCRSDPAAEAAATATGACTLTPQFAGLRDAASALHTTCRVDLGWDAATSQCGGPVTYNLYRSTTPGFTPDAATLLVSGLATTSAGDVSGLVDAQTYYYVVQAVDQSNGVEDGNQVELAVTVGGPNSGIRQLLDEDFEAPDSLDGWTVLTGPGTHTCGEWVRSNAPAHLPFADAGFYALALSENCHPLLAYTSTSLDSPALDLDFSGIVSVTLHADVYYKHLNGDDATIEVWDGSAWQVIWTDPNADVKQRLDFNVTAHAAGNPQFRVRFNYQNAANDRWFSVDNVQVISDAVNACVPGPAPAPVPDGAAATTPLRAERTDTAGNSIEVSWDATSCPAPAYTLLYGGLAGVASLSLDGGLCDVGTGSYAWNGVPAGDLFFLVVGADGASTESRWGDGALGERNGLTASAECGALLKDVSGSCP